MMRKNNWYELLDPSAGPQIQVPEMGWDEELDQLGPIQEWDQEDIEEAKEELEAELLEEMKPGELAFWEGEQDAEQLKEEPE